MSVLSSNDIARIDAIQADMAQRFDVQRSIIVPGQSRSVGFVTRFKKTGKYHVYTDTGCVAMLNSARALFDDLTYRFPGWALDKGQRSR